jgi:hypothetical protein
MVVNEEKFHPVTHMQSVNILDGYRTREDRSLSMDDAVVKKKHEIYRRSHRHCNSPGALPNFEISSLVLTIRF